MIPGIIYHTVASKTQMENDSWDSLTWLCDALKKSEASMQIMHV